MDSAIRRIDATIKSSSGSILGKGEYRVRGFDSAVDSAVRSRTASNSEIFSVHGFGWTVKNAIQSTTAPDFQTHDSVRSFGCAVENAIRSGAGPNPPPLHSFASAVDEAICSRVVAEAEVEGETEESPNREGYAGSWHKGCMLGKGSFGTVYEAVHEDGYFFAVKEVSLLDHTSEGRQSIFQLRQERFLLSQFQHDNIIQYLGTDKDNDKQYIFLGIGTKGSLAVLYQNYQLMDSQVSAYTRQILSGLKYLHDRNVVHRDIKCANILIDATGSIKLADFGLAKITKLNDVKSIGGSLNWIAPEVVKLRSCGYGLAADIWSLGCTVLEMLTRQPPYYHLEEMQVIFQIGSGDPPPVPASLSTNARDFILECLQADPNKRPTVAQLLDHPFVNLCTTVKYGDHNEDVFLHSEVEESLSRIIGHHNRTFRSGRIIITQ